MPKCTMGTFRNSGFRDEVLGGRSTASRGVLVYVRIASTAQRRNSPENEVSVQTNLYPSYVVTKNEFIEVPI